MSARRRARTLGGRLGRGSVRGSAHMREGSSISPQRVLLAGDDVVKGRLLDTTLDTGNPLVALFSR